MTHDTTRTELECDTLGAAVDGLRSLCIVRFAGAQIPPRPEWVAQAAENRPPSRREVRAWIREHVTVPRGRRPAEDTARPVGVSLRPHHLQQLDRYGVAIGSRSRSAQVQWALDELSRRERDGD